MKSESAIISFINNFPVSASLKDTHTGKYIVNNRHNSRQFGVEDPRDIEGLTIRDLGFRQTEWGNQYAQSIEKHDFLTNEKRTSVTRRNVFLDDSGDVQMEEMTKFPITGVRGNVLGIATFRHDITRTLPPINIFQLNRKLYGASDAIDRTMTFLQIKSFFITPPTEAQLRVFLLKAERLTNKEISIALGISDRTVECHSDAVRNKIANDSLSAALARARGAVECRSN